MSIKRDIRDYLLDISDSLNDIRNFIEEMTYEEFIVDRKTVNAVIRSLEIIGEAVKKIPESIRANTLKCPGKKLPVCVISSSMNISGVISILSG